MPKIDSKRILLDWAPEGQLQNVNRCYCLFGCRSQTLNITSRQRKTYLFSTCTFYFCTEKISDLSHGLILRPTFFEKVTLFAREHSFFSNFFHHWNFQGNIYISESILWIFKVKLRMSNSKLISKQKENLQKKFEIIHKDIKFNL